MNKFAWFAVSSLSACMIAGALSLPVSALAADESTSDEKPAMDCSKAPHPERCAAFKQAFEMCKDKPKGPDRRACIKSNMPAKPSAPKS
jgi:predicted small lipoprotein YifL